MDRIEKDIRKRWAPVLNRYKKSKKPVPDHYNKMLAQEIKETKQAIKNADKINENTSNGGK